MFTNAKSVYIKGKEVQSIVAFDGGVLYQLIERALSLSSDKSVIYSSTTAILTTALIPQEENKTIYLYKIIDDTNLNLNLTQQKNGTTFVITATVTDENDNGLENIHIKLFKEGDNLAKELIATLTTDSNGEATYNYIGTGAGETTFIAESGELESDPLIIYDTFINLTVSSDKNILSYADEDTATITTALTGEEDVSNKIITFEEENGKNIFNYDISNRSSFLNFEGQSGIIKLIDSSQIYFQFDSGGHRIDMESGESVSSEQSQMGNVDYFSDQSFEVIIVDGIITSTTFSLSNRLLGKQVIGFKNISNCSFTASYMELTTDSNGIIEYEYTSQGIGDININVKYMFLQETYELQDCIYFHDMTSADSTHWTIPSNANASYSSKGMKFSGASFCDAYLNVPLTKPYSVEFDLMEWSGSPNFLHYLWDSTKTTRHIATGYNNSKTFLEVYPNTDNFFDGSIPQGSHIKIEIGNDVCKLYVDDTLKLTKSYTMPSSSILGLAKSGSCPITRKNIKIKPL